MAGALGGCGRRSAESKAAEQAQDACIGTLEPVARDAVPSNPVLAEALHDAEEAASVDDRWESLLVGVRAVVRARGTAAFDPAIDALAAECGRVNDIIRRGGKDPATA